MSLRMSVMVSAIVVGLAGEVAAQVKLDPKLPDYKPVAGVSGSIKSVGSDTMNNLMTLWGEGFAKYYPNVRIEVEGKGSGTAPPALIAGTATFGPMSRPMKASEIDAFEKKFGYKPTALSTSIDMLAVFVNKDNPIKGLTLQQLDAVFSRTRKAGYAEDIRTWGQLGLTGDWTSAPISIFGRNSASGTYAFFKEKVLEEGDYKDSVKEQPGSSAVVQGVASDRFAIGYSGIGYKTADVRVVPLTKAARGPFVAAEPANVASYPLSRFLYLNVNFQPGSQLDPLRREFIRFVFSKPGQEVVVKDGYLPVSAKMAAKALSEVGIQSGL
jgi:phosphate transport system substrate-binding protein